MELKLIGNEVVYFAPLLENMGIVSLCETSEERNREHPEIIYFVSHCVPEMVQREARLVSYHTHKGTVKVYFWCSNNDFLRFTSRVPKKNIVAVGEGWGLRLRSSDEKDESRYIILKL